MIQHLIDQNKGPEALQTLVALVRETMERQGCNQEQREDAREITEQEVFEGLE